MALGIVMFKFTHILSHIMVVGILWHTSPSVSDIIPLTSMMTFRTKVRNHVQYIAGHSYQVYRSLRSFVPTLYLHMIMSKYITSVWPVSPVRHYLKAASMYGQHFKLWVLTIDCWWRESNAFIIYPRNVSCWISDRKTHLFLSPNNYWRRKNCLFL